MPSPQYNSIVFTQEDWRVLDVLETRNFAALKGITDDMSKDITRALSEGVTAGKGMPDLSKAISDATGMAKTRADRMARTETINACVDAARSRYQELGVKEFEFVAASDDRLCDICASFNGKIYKLTDDAHLPPIHPNCRCAIAPIIGDRKEEILKETKGTAGVYARGNKPTTESKNNSPVMNDDQFTTIQKLVAQLSPNNTIILDESVKDLDFKEVKTVIKSLKTISSTETGREALSKITKIDTTTKPDVYLGTSYTKDGSLIISINHDKFLSKNIRQTREDFQKETCLFIPNMRFDLEGRHEGIHADTIRYLLKAYSGDTAKVYNEWKKITSTNQEEWKGTIIFNLIEKAMIESNQKVRDISLNAFTTPAEAIVEAILDVELNKDKAQRISITLNRLYYT